MALRLTRDERADDSEVGCEQMQWQSRRWGELPLEDSGDSVGPALALLPSNEGAIV